MAANGDGVAGIAVRRQVEQPWNVDNSRAESAVDEKDWRFECWCLVEWTW